MKDSENQEQDSSGTQPPDQDVAKAVLDGLHWNVTEFPRLFGWEFKKLREELGYTAREVAESFHRQRIPLRTARSIYRIEEERNVKPRYVEAFRQMVGEELFNQTLGWLRNSPGGYRYRYVNDVLFHREHTEHLQRQVEDLVRSRIERARSRASKKQ